MSNPPKSASEQWALAQQAKSHVAEQAPTDIKTAAERDSLVAQRDLPKLEPHLKPTGPIHIEVDANLAAQREARIKEINTALLKAKNNFKKEFEHSK